MRPVSVLAGIAGLMLASVSVMAQVTQTTAVPPAQNPPRLAAATAPHLDITPYGGGFVSQDYDDTNEGIQIEQSLTQGLGLIGRATGYQLYLRENAVSPLQPSSTQTEARLNFGRFEGGVDISPVEGTNLYLLGGHDAGDSDAFVVEGDLSSWMFPSSAHPINLFLAPIYDTENKVTSSEIDFRLVAGRSPDWAVVVGAGGAVYGGGFLHRPDGQGGPILGLYNNFWKLGGDLQAGYGTPGGYGELTIYKTFSLWE